MSQLPSLLIFLALSLIAAIAFIFVWRSTRDPVEVPYEAVTVWRRRLFFFMGAGLLLFLALTLPLMPYPHRDQTPDRVVHVRARQFLFEFSAEAFPPGDALGGAVPVPPVKAGELVEYRVSSADTTHGFGIYDEKGDLFTQVQAMPGYVNRLRVRFPKAGNYNVLCMEYCGMAHHVMRSIIPVVAE